MNNYEQGHDTGDHKLNIDAKPDSSRRPKMPLAAVIGASAICSLAIPVVGSGTPISDLCAWAICFIALAYLILSTKRFVIRAACIFICSLAFAAFGSIAPVALVLGPIFSISLGAFSISRAKRYAIIPALAIPISSYALAFALTGDAIISLASLSFVPVLIALGIANMVAETIAMLAVFAARSYKIKNVVLTGNLTSIKAIAKVFEGLEQNFGVKFIIPEMSQFATVIGAALCDNGI